MMPNPVFECSCGFKTKYIGDLVEVRQKVASSRGGKWGALLPVVLSVSHLQSEYRADLKMWACPMCGCLRVLLPELMKPAVVRTPYQKMMRQFHRRWRLDRFLEDLRNAIRDKDRLFKVERYRHALAVAVNWMDRLIREEQYLGVKK